MKGFRGQWGCVFPTHVGVFPYVEGTDYTLDRLPHARGGVSLPASLKPTPGKSSPRTWGCFYGFTSSGALLLVFPTHVGVFLLLLLYPVWELSLPHARGGVSINMFRMQFETGLPHARGGVSGTRRLVNGERRSSPRTWGCFSPASSDTGDIDVFPTHVGVFPLLRYAGQGRPGLPHARGGVSFLDKIWG